MTENGGWDNTSTPSQQIPHQQGGSLPVARAGHTQAWQNGAAASMVFGGQIAGGSYKQELWLLRHAGSPFDDDFVYEWERATPTVSPDPRAQHTAVVMADNSMVVYGGVGHPGANDVVLDDGVWRLSPSEPWTWTQLSTTSSELPGPRQGHTAIYDQAHDRVLMFGGASTTGGTPTLADNEVWSLKIDKTIPTAPKAVWSKLPLRSGSGRPLPRTEHVMVYDGGDRGHIHGGGIHLEHRAVMYGGRLSSGALTDSVWTLWIDASGDSVDWRQPTLAIQAGSAGPGARAKHGAVRSSTWIVTLGGERDNNSAPDSVWALDLTDPLPQYPDYDSLTWRPMQSNPAPRTDVPAFEPSGLVYPRTTEVFSPATATWDTIASASLPSFWYPYLFQLPSGKLFDAGASLETYRLNDLSGGAWEEYPTTPSSLYGGSAVMYRAGKVMKCGTRDTETGAVAVRTTQRIDLNESSPSWSTDAQMDEGRVYHNLTLLPSGEVLATSGTAQSDPNVIIDARLRPDLWRPDSAGASGVWYGGATSSVPLAIEPLSRNYHASAMLLPDGRVLTGGGNTGVSGGGVDSSAMVSIYCPPYLFNADGSRATRPRILSAHRVVGYGRSFYISVDTLASISKACLIRAGSVTHAFNFDQRYVELSFTDDSTNCRLTATAPSDSSSFPPGDYLLFVLNMHGVPSIASWVRLRSGTNGDNPSIPCGGGCPFVDTRTAAGWQVENSVLSRSLSGAMSLDAYRLKGAPEIKDGRVQLRVRENEQEYTTLDQVQLATVDHLPDVQAFASGSSVLLGTHVPAYKVTTRTGKDITSLLDGSFYFVGEPGETLTVQMYAGGKTGALGAERIETGGPGEIDPGDKGGGGGTRVRVATGDGVAQGEAVDALILGSSGIRLQGPDGSGGWRTLETRYPREDFDEQVLDSLGGDMRLIFIGRHRLRFVGHIEVVDKPTPQILTLLSATHSRLGDQIVAVSTTGATTTALTPGDTLTLEFAAPQIAKGMVRDWVVLSSGAYSSVLPAAQQTADAELLPTRFALLQNRPNPFSSTTSIHFELPQAARVKIEIFDLQGRRVRRLVDHRYEAGRWSVEWDRLGSSGLRVSPGIYLYRMQAAAFSAERKMILMP